MARPIKIKYESAVYHITSNLFSFFKKRARENPDPLYIFQSSDVFSVDTSKENARESF